MTPSRVDRGVFVTSPANVPFCMVKLFGSKFWPSSRIVNKCCGKGMLILLYFQ